MTLNVISGKKLDVQLLLWNLQTVSFSNLIAAVSGDQCNCNNWDFSVQLYWLYIENESYHRKITFELEERRIVYQGQWSWSLLSLLSFKREQVVMWLTLSHLCCVTSQSL